MFLLFLVIGAGAIVFSAIAWRTRNKTIFIMGCVFEGLLLLYAVWNFDHFVHAVLNPLHALDGLFFLAFFAISAYFLISSQLKIRGREDLTDSDFEEIMTDNSDANTDEGGYVPTDKDFNDFTIETEDEEEK